MDREKVIKGLERCVEKLDTVVNKMHGFNCTACPYFRKCDRNGYLIGIPLMRDALALLKAQEPRVMTLEEIEDWDGAVFFEAYETDMYYALIETVEPTAGMDGEFVFVNVEPGEHYRRVWGGENYGSIWRCWTSRPTDEQMKAVKWE